MDAEILRRLEMIQNRLDEMEHKEAVERPIDMDAVCAWLNMHKSTLYKKVITGEFPHYKVGRKTYFYKSELDRVVKKGKIKSTRERIGKVS